MFGKLSDGLKLVIEKNGRIIFKSADSGVKPITDSIMQCGEKLKGATAIDWIVGLAAAKLFVHAGIKTVYGKTMSKPAYSFLKQKKVSVFAENIVENIMNKEKTDICQFEKLSKNVGGEEFFQLVKQKIYKKTDNN